MQDAAMVFPLVPGKRPVLDAFVEALAGERSAEYDESQTTVLWESWFVQPTPIGDLVIMTMSAPDPVAVFTGLAAADGPFEVWFREQVLEITGVDLSQPPPGLPERVFHWERK